MNNLLTTINPKAKIYDVTADQWLGDKNELAYGYINGVGHLLFLNKRGELNRHTKKPRGIVKHLNQCPLLERANEPMSLRMLNIVMQSELDHALAERQLDFYQQLPEDGVHVRLDLHHFKAGHCRKSNRYSFKDRYALPHCKSNDGGVTYESAVSSSMFADPMQVLMHRENATEFLRRCEALSKSIGISLDHYHQGHGLVNLALLHVAQLLGGSAEVFPYDPKIRSGKVVLGPVILQMTETLYMDLELWVNGERIDDRQNICAVPEREIINASAAFPQKMLILPLSLAAFEMLQAQRKTLRKALREDKN